jgi:hypothetical protein
MLEQSILGERIQSFKNKMQSFMDKFRHQSEQNDSDKQEDKAQLDLYEFTPDDQVSTSPRLKNPNLSDGTAEAQKIVWENEDASMQDKSYSFDEVTTDADYDVEDEFDFENESDIGRVEESRNK